MGSLLNCKNNIFGLLGKGFGFSITVNLDIYKGTLYPITGQAFGNRSTCRR